jgi:hypothetical protein
VADALTSRANAIITAAEEAGTEQAANNTAAERAAEEAAADAPAIDVREAPDATTAARPNRPVTS